MIYGDKASSVVTRVERSGLSGPALRREAMRVLAELPNYNWCGVYRLEPDGLHLDEFVGAETEHTLIPVGRGVCGTAVAEDRNQIVDDVRRLENYLACSTETRSEIVVLVRSEGGEMLGQIDIDSRQPAAFDVSDEELLERIGVLLADRWT